MALCTIKYLYYEQLGPLDLLSLPKNLNSPRILSGGSFIRALVLRVTFVDRCLSFFFWSLRCLSLRILITPLVSSNSSYRTLQYYTYDNFCEELLYMYNALCIKFTIRTLRFTQSHVKNNCMSIDSQYNLKRGCLSLKTGLA